MSISLLATANWDATAICTNVQQHQAQPSEFNRKCFKLVIKKKNPKRTKADHIEFYSLPVKRGFPYTDTHTQKKIHQINFFLEFWDNFWKRYCNTAGLWNLHLSLLCITTTYVVYQQNKKNFQLIFHNLTRPIFFLLTYIQIVVELLL